MVNQQIEVLLVAPSASSYRQVSEMMGLTAETRLAVTMCTGMDAALANLSCCPVDAVVLAWSPGGEEYWNALDSLISVQPAVPVVVVSTTDDYGAGLETLRAGAEDFLLMNEISGVALVRAIRFAVERSRVRDTHRHLRDYEYTTFEQAAVGIAHVSLDGRVLRLNSRLCRFLDYSRETLMGMRLEDITHPDDMGPDREHMQRLLSGEASRYSLEKRYIRRDGSSIWGNLTVAMARDMSGEPAFFISVVEDISERKRAETALRESEARFRRLIESNVFGVLLGHQDGAITYANPSLLRLLGYTEDDLVQGRFRWDELTPVEFRARDEKARQELETTGSCAPYEKAFMSRDGRRVPVLVGASVLDQQAEADYGPLIAASVTDLSDLQKVEEALRISEERFRTALKGSPITVFNQDLELRYTWVHNPIWARFGDEILGKTDDDVMEEPSDAEILGQLKRRVLESGLGLRQEVLLYHDGQPTYVDLTIEPLRDVFGHVIGVTCAAMDITHLKQVERSEREQRILAEALRDVAIALNRHQEFSVNLDRIIDNIRRVVAHDAAEVLMIAGERTRVVRGRGYTTTELEDARSQASFVPREVRGFRQIMDSHQPVVIADLAADGLQEDQCLPLDPAWRSFVGVPVMLAGEIVGFVVLLANKTNAFTSVDADRLQAFAEMVTIAVQNVQSREQEQALAAVQERQRLARELHDAVSQTLFSATIMAESLTRLADRHPERLRDGLTQLHRLTQGALAEMRTLLLELRPASLVSVDFADLVHQLADAVRSRKRIAIEVDVAPQIDLPSEAKFALYRITQEALNNVAKHAGATTARVVGVEEGGLVVLTVSDDGRGFDRAQVSSTSLGLGIMEERAHAAGASFDLESRPGAGTRVQVIWPDPGDSAGKDSNR